MRMLAELGKRALGWLRAHRGVVALGAVASVLSFPKLSYAVSLDRFFLNPFDSTALLLAGIINNITAVIGKVMLAVIEILIVPILGYNGFSSADIVDLGWSLVRDVVNMGVVVILIVIAMQTIVGYSKANWTQQLPRLFIGVILVNFSRTICGVLIDISQVVMFTFVNAIIDIAAGNFAQMFGLSQFGEFSNDFIDKVNESGTGIEAYAYLGSAYLQLALYLAIFSVIALLALMYIWRIVMLWLLIIMSPIAFFLNGLGDMFKASSGYYQEWWKKFSGALIMGPLLTFFLWLALAAASGSNLAVTQDFPLPEEQGEYGLALENFSMDSLLGTFVALLLLIVGMQLASASAGAIGGPVSKYISEDMGKKIVSGAVKLPAQYAGKGAAAGARFADKKVGAHMDRFAEKNGMAKFGTASARFGKDVVQTGKQISSIPVVGGYLGNKVANAGGAMVAATKAKKAEERKKAQERIKGMDSVQRNALIADMADGGKMFGGLPSEEQEAMRVSMATDLKAQKAAEADLKAKYGDDEGKKKYEALMSDSIEAVDKNKDDWLDAAGKDALVGTMTANLHLLKAKTEKKKQPDGTLKEVVKSKDDVVRDFVSDQQAKGGFKVRLMKAEALKDDSVKKALESETVVREGKNITLLDDISRGSHGKELQDAALGNEKLKEKPVPKEKFMIPAGSPPERSAEVVKNVRAVVSNSAVGSLEPEALTEFKNALNTLPPDAISHVTRVSADEQLLRKGSTASEVYGPVPTTGPSVTPNAQLRMMDLVERDPSNAGYLSDQLDASLTASGDKANEVTEAIADGVRPDNIKKLRTSFDRAEGPEKEKLRKSIATIEKAVDKELAYQEEVRNDPARGERYVDKEYEKKLKNTKRQIKLLGPRSGTGGP